MNKIEVLRDKLLRWYFRLKAANGELIVHSESYYSKSNAVRAAKRFSVMLKGKVTIEVL